MSPSKPLAWRVSSRPEPDPTAQVDALGAPPLQSGTCVRRGPTEISTLGFVEVGPSDLVGEHVMPFQPSKRLQALPPYLFIEIDRRKK